MFKKYLKLLSYIGPYKKRRLSIIILSSISMIINCFLPFLIGELVNMINSSNPVKEIIDFGWKAGVVAIVAALLESLQYCNWHMYAVEFINYFRGLTLKAALNKDISYYRMKQEDFSTRILLDSSTIANDICVGFPVLILNVANLLVVFGFMLYMNVKLALIPLIAVPVFVMLFHFLDKGIREKSKSERRQFSELSELIKEYLDGIFDIKINRNEEYFQNKFNNEIKDYSSTEKKIKLYTALSYGVNMIVKNLLPISVLLYGVVLVSKGELEIGYLFAFYTYLGFLYEPMSNLVDWYTLINVSLGMSDRVLEFLETEEEESHGIKVDSIESIEVKNLQFSYNGEDQILESIDFSLNKGDILAVVGPSGSGKSTLIEILLKIWDEYKGSIKVNGIELKEIDKTTFYDEVAVLEQEPFIFTGSIEDNIVFDAQKPNLNSIISHSNLNNIIKNKGGLHSKIFGGGKNLSGGEKQRIALARVLFKRANLIFLDEFTSSLDLESEKEIVNSIGNLDRKDKIVILITHRQYPLKLANKILKLEGGTGELVEKIVL
ncbi:ABC transporter ATP-binding protein [Lagierella sp.]|uniref:ABC transporter ATP-binding protein n=1 Tax=Lagierella sp. TaxID=2849657 RepID=UPI00262F3DDB|nr:ABC transporter ATP-binding protein [Lagierella sp.]